MRSRRRSRTPVRGRLPNTHQLDLALGVQPGPPRRDLSARRLGRSGRLNAAQAPKWIACIWSAPHPLGVHPDAGRFEQVRRRHGDCPELLLELTADGYLRVRCAACRTQLCFRVPLHRGDARMTTANPDLC
jgi:hypothetical protein